ncbi:hypothetical protein Tco_0750928 [Tanacetum coccineum]|uniref:Uncharacterized protein n=1 Tax=Tanacetum coccineum TaxID=301880 RepID=A0ABQ4Z5T9_9ASTR
MRWKRISDKKMKHKAKNDKTEHGMEKCENTKSNRSQRLKSTAEIKRPQPRSNPKNHRIPSVSKISCLSNNIEKVEEHHKNLQFFKTPNHMSSEGNDIKLAIRNEKCMKLFDAHFQEPDGSTIRHHLLLDKVKSLGMNEKKRVKMEIRERNVIEGMSIITGTNPTRISFDESDDEDYTIVFDKNSFSYQIISTNDLKMDLENDNEKVNKPLLPSPEPSVSCNDDLDFFKAFENEFPAIIYNDALTSKSDFSTEPTLCPQHIDKFDLKDETSLSEYDEVEQSVLYFNDRFPFNIVYPNDLKSNKGNDDNKIDMIQSLGVRIYQKSQENHQKRASTDTGTEECTKAESKAKKKSTLSQTVKGKSNHGQQKGTEVYSRAPKHNGKVNSVKSRAIISHSNNEAHVSLKKAHMDVGFALISLRKETQVSLKWIASLAIRVRSLSDLTAQNVDPMIG